MQFDMGLTGTSVVMKYLIFVFNLIFVVFGIVLISVGAVIKAEYANYEWFLDNRFFSVPALLIAIGAIIFVVAFFGCCGVVKENHCMILTFSVLLVVIFVLEFAAGIAGYVLRDNAEQFIVTKLKDSMQHYNDSDGGSSEMWDRMQRTFLCCGVSRPEDWLDTHPDGNESLSLPTSCCHLEIQVWGGAPCTNSSSNLNHNGCLSSLEHFAASHATTLGGIGIGIAIVQFLGMVFACFLARNIRNRNVSV